MRRRIKWTPKQPFYPLGSALYPDVISCGFCEKEMRSEERYGFLINYDPVRPCCKECAKGKGIDE